MNSLTQSKPTTQVVLIALLIAYFVLPLRAADAPFTITTFDPPGSRDTFPNGINAECAITGFYLDANFVFHGFLLQGE